MIQREPGQMFSIRAQDGTGVEVIALYQRGHVAGDQVDYADRIQRFPRAVAMRLDHSDQSIARLIELIRREAQTVSTGGAFGGCEVRADETRLTPRTDQVRPLVRKVREHNSTAACKICATAVLVNTRARIERRRDRVVCAATTSSNDDV